MKSHGPRLGLLPWAPSARRAPHNQADREFCKPVGTAVTWARVTNA